MAKRPDVERRVVWSAAAQRDLEAIVDYIADHEPHNALRVFDRLHARAETLRAPTLRGRIVPELRDIVVGSHRELIDPPWRIIYRCADERIFVVALLDARRDLHAVLLERLLAS